MNKIITSQIRKDIVLSLNAGDMVLLDGIIYTARDAAHRKFINILADGGELPFDIRNQVIYYSGPCPAKPGFVIGPAGPTTSGRMDAYTPRLIEMGLAGMIGKGNRSREVVDAMVKYGAVYFGAVGGAGALISRCIKKQELVAFPELGPEALLRLEVSGFPLTIIIDSKGNNLYESGRLNFSC